MRRLIFNLHLYTALVAGIVVLILGVTGSIMAFENDLDRIFNPGLFKVPPSSVQPGSQPLSIPALENAVKQAYPSQKSYILHLPSRPDEAYYTQSRDMQVFIDGYTGKIIGTRAVPTVMMRIHQLHLRLLLGATGATIVAVVGFIVVWLVISGVYLWWPQKRVKVKSSGSFVRVLFDLHNVVGIYSAVFLLMLAVTGILVHFDHAIEASINKVNNATTPPRNLPSIVQNNVNPISSDVAIEIARTTLPGAVPAMLLKPVGPKGSYTILTPFPEDVEPGRSWVNLDQYSGKVLFAESSRQAPAGTKFVIDNRAIHTGDIFGYPTKFLVSIASLMIVLQVITGYCLWWKKIRVRNVRR